MHRLTWPFLLLLVAAAVLRFAALASFPELNPDEGLWTNSTKNFLVFGDWFMDGRKHLFLSPVFHGLTLAAFATLDPGIVVARALSALLGTLSIALLYGTTKALTDDVGMATAASVLFGFNRFSLYLSRAALLESTTLFFILSAAFLVARRGRFSAVLGGSAMGIALLTKTTAVCIVPSLALLVALLSKRLAWRDRLTASAVFVSVAGLLAGFGYGSMYLWQPQQFVAAFTFELDGVHFGTRPQTLISVGRFALAPAIVAETVDSLASEFPLLFALGLLGLPVAWDQDRRQFWFFGSWLIVGASFFLLQLYQPLRYFLLLTPALAFFGATLLVSLRKIVSPATGRWIVASSLSLYAAYNVGGFVANGLMNPSSRLSEVVEWANENAARDDVFMAAAYFCTDIQQRAYSHYDLALTGDDLLRNIATYDIAYVIYDDTEWNPELRIALEQNFEVVHEWDFGAVYSVMPTQSAIRR